MLNEKRRRGPRAGQLERLEAIGWAEYDPRDERPPKKEQRGERAGQKLRIFTESKRVSKGAQPDRTSEPSLRLSFLNAPTR